MRTVIASDLHLGAGHGSDLLRIERFQDTLLESLKGADQVLLLGDVVELRDTPVHQALEAATPFFERLGEAAASARIVIVPGNHDHRLAADWLDRRRNSARAEPPALKFEQFAKPTAGPAAKLARVLRSAGAGEVTLAYPGVWVNETVYATHGHYLDPHLTVPTFERLGVGLVERVLGGLPAGPRTPDDYERILAPVYAFLYELAQAGDETRTEGVTPSVRIWQTLSGTKTSRVARIRSLLIGSVALPGAVRAANRLGLGRFSADVSLKEISRASTAAMREAIRSLGIEAEHVIFGHSHRRGPLPGDSAAAWEVGPTKLHNTGSWVWSPLLVGTSKRSPYWPGTIAVVEDDGQPELLHLLEGLERREIHEAVKSGGAEPELG